MPLELRVSSSLPIRPGSERPAGRQPAHPHTPTHLPCEWAASTTFLIRARTAGWRASLRCARAGFAAFGCQGILGQVVGADTEENRRVLGNPSLSKAAEGISTMMPVWMGHWCSISSSEAPGEPHRQLPGLQNLFEAGNHRDHDAKMPSPRRAGWP